MGNLASSQSNSLLRVHFGGLRAESLRAPASRLQVQLQHQIFLRTAGTESAVCARAQIGPKVVEIGSCWDCCPQAGMTPVPRLPLRPQLTMVSNCLWLRCFTASARSGAIGAADFADAVAHLAKGGKAHPARISLRIGLAVLHGCHLGGGFKPKPEGPANRRCPASVALNVRLAAHDGPRLGVADYA